jgi:hypothetical protein
MLLATNPQMQKRVHRMPALRESIRTSRIANVEVGERGV